MADTDIFPDMSGEDILNQAGEVWDFERPYIWPKVDLRCAACGMGTLHPRYWRYFKRGEESRVPHRCDVSVKCTTCSLVMVFGVPIPAWHFEMKAEREEIVNEYVWWRDVRYVFEQDVNWEEIRVDE